MAIVNGYCTRAQLTAELDSSGSATLDDDRVDLIAYQASRTIEEWTGRQFYPTIATRYFTSRHNDWFSIDDLLSVTTIKQDTDGNRTYDETWASTDYDLEPYNILDFNKPYQSIALTPDTTVSLAGYTWGIEIAGKWGYYEVTETARSLLNGAISSTTAKTIPVDWGSEFSVGHIILVDSEYMRVDGSAGNDLTVTRGINGSTAATHTDDSTIYVLTFPTITMCTLRLATRMWHLRTAPMGVATAGVQGFGGSTGGTRWIQEDRDLQSWLEPFMTGRSI